MSGGKRIEHKSVLLREVIEALDLRDGMIVVDCTVGLGGHTEAIAEGIAPSGHIVGIDQDQGSLERARTRLERFGDRIRLIHANFKDIGSVLAAEQIKAVDGMLMDIGFSSWQIDSAERGFSFLHEGPLDMRMDCSQTLDAATVVATYKEQDLAHIIFTYGEERLSRVIARAICRYRQNEPITTTTTLAHIIQQAVPKRYRFGRIHPATRTFQALRIVVNGELDALRAGLDSARQVIRPGGRLCVISFHSLEDRIVKRTFRAWAADGRARLITKRPLRPSDDECSDNPRARSARMRVIEMLANDNHEEESGV